jgi:hypothetical protein
MKEREKSNLSESLGEMMHWMDVGLYILPGCAKPIQCPISIFGFWAEQNQEQQEIIVIRARL